ncbi:MAG: septum formation protein Maf [Anaerolineae bacterium]|nr:septum formation protein Maf [Anaerolineae bacterium]
MGCHKVILASQSPRRREMIKWLGVPFDVTHADVDERSLSKELPLGMAARLAVSKAKAVSYNLEGWILSADTIVELDGDPLGKPEDAAAAYAMLLKLRGNGHYVHTGVALFNPLSGQVLVRRVTTHVWMRPYTEPEIQAYIASGDPMDKAGAYAIQNTRFNPVGRLAVCYANVVGLPVCAVVALLQDWGCELELDIPALCQRNFGYHCPGPDGGVLV